MAKATVSLLAAADAAAKANTGFRAVSVYPQLRNRHPVAEVTLLQGTTTKKGTSGKFSDRRNRVQGFCQCAGRTR
jgi:hypothetical protein